MPAAVTSSLAAALPAVALPPVRPRRHLAAGTAQPRLGCHRMAQAVRTLLRCPALLCLEYRCTTATAARLPTTRGATCRRAAAAALVLTLAARHRRHNKRSSSSRGTTTPRRLLCTSPPIRRCTARPSRRTPTTTPAAAATAPAPTGGPPVAAPTAPRCCSTSRQAVACRPSLRPLGRQLAVTPGRAPSKARPPYSRPTPALAALPRSFPAITAATAL